MSNPSNHNRQDDVLGAVIQSHVETARPVGSSHVAEGLDLSPATIRNTFADLERQGLLTHPHTSAGRIPTDLGYRLYVDRLLTARQLTLKEKQTIEREYEKGRAEIEILMRQTARVLSAMTRLAGVASYRAPEELTLDHFKIVPLTSRQVMVFLVLDDVWVEEERIHLDDPLDPGEVSRITKLLNRRFAGLPLPRIRDELLSELDRSKAGRLSILQAVADLLDGAMGVHPDHVIVEGTARLAEQPEFRAPAAMEDLLRVVENREGLAHALGGRPGPSGLSIDIGGELRDSRLKSCSFVHVPFRFRGRFMGALGVLGPVRMPYDRVAGLVEHVSVVLETNLFEREKRPHG